MFQPEFINKEAAVGFARAVGSKVNRKAKDVARPVNLDNVESFSRDQIEDGIRIKRRQDGNGLFGDVGIWGAGFITPKSWNTKERILKPLDTMKQKMDDFSTDTAGKIIGKKPDDSMRARFWSVPDTKIVGKETLEDGTIRELADPARRASLMAPLQNTAKVTSPFLASMYLAEKMYPNEGKDNQPSLERQAFEREWMEEKNGLEDELLTERLDKEAALDKVAHLQTQIEKLASELEEAEHEKNLFWKKAEEIGQEKLAALKEKERIENELLNKEASFKEFQLRTAAKERSKHAVKIAEGMLDAGLIKQAEFKEKVDFFMDCDDKTLNLHSSFVKRAEAEEKGLESSAFFIDYRDKDEESSPHRAGRGLSKRGQTIGEAAKDLNK